MSRPAKTGPDQEVGGATHPIDSAMQPLNSWGYHFRNNFFLSFFLVLCMDVDVENLRIVSGSADNKICVSLISSEVSVLNARGGGGGAFNKVYPSTLLDSLSMDLDSGFQTLAGFRIP